MIIAVNGYVINTENFYTIGPVSENREDIDEDILAYNFEIRMFNNVVHYVYSKKNITRDELEVFRQSIVEIWAANQSTLPQFEI
jgi:hypothetical protein